MRVLVLTIMFISILFNPARGAEDTSGCDKFAWSIVREHGWFAASDKPVIAAGSMLSSFPRGAFVLDLQPGTRASFTRPPERAPKSEGWFGGAVWLPAIERPGIYQVTLSEEAWIDVVQDDRFARSIGSSGRRDCQGLRKSVRFELSAAPAVLQLSGAAAESVAVAITPVE